MKRWQQNCPDLTSLIGICLLCLFASCVVKHANLSSLSCRNIMSLIKLLPFPAVEQGIVMAYSSHPTHECHFKRRKILAANKVRDAKLHVQSLHHFLPSLKCQLNISAQFPLPLECASWVPSDIWPLPLHHFLSLMLIVQWAEITTFLFPMFKLHDDS